ncbi:MAG: transcription antitermination factor NusB [Betaproteobacteria bacterium]|nr:transcription antitermination factor NusB [Betaproteobacteria bacterium]
MKTTPRRRARELVLQGLYERQVGGADPAIVASDLAASPGHLRADQPYFAELWKGVTEDYETLLAALAPHLDRAPAALSPIERGILVIGAWELRQRLEIPYKVVINEAVELGKSYGATDGHKYVNGVLDKLAADLRRHEIAAARSDTAS